MKKNVNTDLEVEPAAAAATVSPVNASSTTRISEEGDGEQESEQNEQNVKTDCDLLVESSESSSSLRVGKRKAAERRELNIMLEDTLEAAIVDLEELVNKTMTSQLLMTHSPLLFLAHLLCQWYHAKLSKLIAPWNKKLNLQYCASR
ncbi:hypothetical protein L1987_58425 [Smallanthus sonchifolius]|uniref:Uncharacterized protein n=1 Tax=Smallanthus sonchifolius TaxID=185202 RepID=A0ACB9DF74_9ASTR|nr:hypothetical protein L1987_58425 [Smallanthus sonchifolius]